MRLAGLALGLILCAGAAAGFEIEERRHYPAEGGEELRVISTGDLDFFAPFLERFREENPEIGIDYVVASSAELYRAIREGAPFDLALSSAMDLQLKLANDGLARPYRSEATAALPDWAKWRDRVFAFTSEPAVVVISRARFEGLDAPATRQELIAILRDNGARFRGAVGTYDVRESGLGYLFATQEARSTDAYWRLTEVMGRLGARLYCCSAAMIEDVAEGRLALAYNVLGSYAEQHVAADPRVEVLTMQDYTNVMLRTALIPQDAERPEAAGRMLDALLESGLGVDAAGPLLPPLDRDEIPGPSAFGPIRLGPSLLVYLDRMKRRAFLDAWESAMEQRR